MTCGLFAVNQYVDKKPIPLSKLELTGSIDDILCVFHLNF